MSHAIQDPPLDTGNNNKSTMEDSTQLGNPESHQNSFSFPPHRRRPLRSKTYFKLIQILSHCENISQHAASPQPVPTAHSPGDNGAVEFGQVTEHSELMKYDEVQSEDLLVQHEQKVVDGSRKNIDPQNGGFRTEEMEVQDLTHADAGAEVNVQVALANSIINRDNVVRKTGTNDCAAKNVDEQESVSSVPGFYVENICPSGVLELDKEVYTGKAFEAINSGSVVNTFESLKLVENCENTGSSFDKTVSKEVEHQLEMKEMELEKIISDPGSMEFSHCVTANEETEEGEISGEAGVHNDLVDMLFEDSMLLDKMTTEEWQVSGDFIDKKAFICDDENRGSLRGDMSNYLSVDRVGDVNYHMEMELGEIVGKNQDGLSQNVLHDSDMETQKVNSIEGSGVNLSPSGNTLQENTVENQVSVTSEKVASDGTKKKKGPLTKERKAKKKKKERIKRAEKNRKLGVKRLKLQPILKPKTITFCRHYIKGRCLEGEKCKFSHDTIPLTKSKPCCHFARHSCMKGDECPFDHQLSKYPCNNYTSKGFCSRGSDCLFSHEMPPAESSFLTSNVSKPDMKSQQQMMPAIKDPFITSNMSKLEVKAPNLLTNSNPDKHLNIHGNAKFCSVTDAPGKSVEQNVSNPMRGTAAQAPKGVNFLFLGKPLLGDSNKNKQEGSSLKSDVGTNVGRDNTALKVSDRVQKLNEVAKTVPPRRPQGINFLSFDKVSFDDSNSKTLSGLLTTKNKEIEKLLLEVGSPQKSSINDKVDGQTSQRTTDMVLNMKEKAGGSSTVVAPRGTSFLSFGKSPLDDSSFKFQAGFHPSQGDTASPFVQEKEFTPARLFGQAKDQLAGGCSSTSISSSSKTSLWSNTTTSAEKAVQSTLAFAAMFEPGIKLSRSIGSPAVHAVNEEAESSRTKSAKA